MIRINLLPVKAAQRRASGVRQVLVGAIAACVVLAGLLVFHTVAERGISAQKAEIARVQQSIAALKAQVGDYDLVRAQREALLRQKAAITKLQDMRSGPAALLRELSDILTKGKGPTIDRVDYDQRLQQDPSAGYNPNWEPRRTWILSWQEKDGAVAIHGGAKSADDAAELNKRLKLSVFFDDSQLKQTMPQTDQHLNSVSYVLFDIQARLHR